MADPETIEGQDFFDTYDVKVTPKLLTRTYIDYPYLTELKDYDFETRSLTMINLSPEFREKPQFVLFIDQEPESQRYLKMWLKVAEQTKSENCDMAFCNLRFEKEIASSFKELGRISNISHPFYWARYQGMPFAIAYRDGWPQGFFNGGFYFPEIVIFASQEIPDPTVELDKFQKIRPGIMNSIRKREMELMEELDRERMMENAVIDKEKLEALNTRSQVIAHAVGFDD